MYDARYHNKYCCYYQTSCYVPKIKVLQLSSHYIIIRNQLHEVFDEFKGLQAHLFKYIHGIRPSSLRCPLKCNNNIYKIYYNCAHYKKNDHIILVYIYIYIYICVCVCVYYLAMKSHFRIGNYIPHIPHDNITTFNAPGLFRASLCIYCLK